MLTLKADIRDTKIKADKIRSAGAIPAVFYGKKEASTPISIMEKDFLKVWKEAGESTVVTLQIGDPSTELGVSKESLIHDVDIDPVSGVPRHADFYVFEKGHKVEVALPIEFTGVSPAVTDLGGILVKVLHELKVEAMPKDLPHNIEIDISSLVNFGDQIAAGDIAMPQGVELQENPEEVVVLVSQPREEKEEEEAPADLSQIEVEKRGKEEETEDTNESESKKETP